MTPPQHQHQFVTAVRTHAVASSPSSAASTLNTGTSPVADNASNSLAGDNDSIRASGTLSPKNSVGVGPAPASGANGEMTPKMWDWLTGCLEAHFEAMSDQLVEVRGTVSRLETKLSKIQASENYIDRFLDY